MRSRWILLCVIALSLAALLIGGCGSKPAAGEGVKVSMKDMAFHPKEVRIKAGMTVTWVNEDVAVHGLSHGKPGEARPLFRSNGDLPAGKSYSFTFTKAGTYPVHCTTPGHADAGMVMTVIVQ